MGKKFVKDLHVVNKILPHLIPTRIEAEVYVPARLDVTDLLKYIEVKNKDLPAEQKITVFHAFATAAAKMIYHRSFMNRFIKARKTYQRDEIIIAFVTRREFKEESDELLVSIKVDPDDNIMDFRDKIVGKVSKARQDDNGMDSLLKVITGFPTPITTLIVGLFKLADNLQILPKSFTEGDPDFATLFCANLGSVKGGAIYHHLNNFGTNSLFASIGLARREEVMVDGKKQQRDILEIGVTMDERISDGFRSFQAFNLLKEIIARPEILDEPIRSEVNL